MIIFHSWFDDIEQVMHSLQVMAQKIRWPMLRCVIWFQDIMRVMIFLYNFSNDAIILDDMMNMIIFHIYFDGIEQVMHSLQVMAQKIRWPMLRCVIWFQDIMRVMILLYNLSNDAIILDDMMNMIIFHIWFDGIEQVMHSLQVMAQKIRWPMLRCVIWFQDIMRVMIFLYNFSNDAIILDDMMNMIIFHIYFDGIEQVMHSLQVMAQKIRWPMLRCVIWFQDIMRVMILLYNLSNDAIILDDMMNMIIFHIWFDGIEQVMHSLQVMAQKIKWPMLRCVIWFQDIMRVMILLYNLSNDAIILDDMMNMIIFHIYFDGIEQVMHSLQVMAQKIRWPMLRCVIWFQDIMRVMIFLYNLSNDAIILDDMMNMIIFHIWFDDIEQVMHSLQVMAQKIRWPMLRCVIWFQDIMQVMLLVYILSNDAIMQAWWDTSFDFKTSCISFSFFLWYD